MSPSSSLVKALGVLLQVFQRQMSPDDAKILVQEYASDLADFPEPSVLEAIRRCRRELRTFPTIADIVARVNDGRPGAEEAWALIPKDESESGVWTEEMREAFNVCRPLLDEDPIAARMAFRETYNKLIAEARSSGAPAQWQVTLGHDFSGRAPAILEAVRLGRLTHEHAVQLIPVEFKPGNLRLLESQVPKTQPNEVREQIAKIKGLLGERKSE